MRRLAISLLFFTGLSFGDSYYIEDTTGTGLSSDDAIAVLQFVRSAVAESGQTVSLERGKADFQLRPKLMRLGKSYIFNLEKRTDRALIFSSQMKAAEVEELDEVVARVTRAVLKGVAVRDDARIDDVTRDEETRGTRRKPARRGSFFAFGPAALSNLNATGVGFYLSGAYAWDVNHTMIRLRADVALNGGALFTDFGIGGSYFLSDRSVAPFIGLDVGFGVARIDQGLFLTNETISGFTVAPVIGIHLLRTSAINLELAGRAAFMLKQGSLGSPVCYSARIGLYF